MKRSRTRFALILALGVLSAAGPSHAQDSQARNDAVSAAEAATFLLVPVGARTIGLGGAATASHGDIEGALWNPATIAGLPGSAIYLMGGPDFAGSVVVAGGVLALGQFRAGLTILHYAHGSVDARDEGNQPLGTIDPSQQAFVLSAAHPLTSWLEAGGSWKLLRIALCSEICGAFDETPTGHAFDVGLVARLPFLDGLQAGLLLRNLGGSVGYSSGSSDPLPTRIRFGLELDLPAVLSPQDPWAGGDLSMLTRLDVQETLGEFDDLDLHVGVEAGWKRLLYVRGGYAASSQGRSGPTIGIGLRVGRFILDFGHSFNDFAQFDTGTPFQLSAGFKL